MTIAFYELIAQLLSCSIASTPGPEQPVCIAHCENWNQKTIVWCVQCTCDVAISFIYRCQFSRSTVSVANIANWNAQPTCNRKQVTVASIHAHKMPIPKMTLNSRRRCANHLFARYFHTYEPTHVYLRTQHTTAIRFGHIYIIIHFRCNTFFYGNWDGFIEN